MAYVWSCNWEDGASSFKDFCRCCSASRKKLKTREEAERAAFVHERRSGHHGWTYVADIGRRKLRRGRGYRR